MINALATAPHPADTAVPRAADARDGVDEAALIVRVARGDEAAYAALYRRVWPTLLAYLARLVATPDLAEEIAQETMLTVWRNAGRFHGQTTGLRWVLVQAYAKAEAARADCDPVHDPLNRAIAAPDAAEAAAVVEMMREAVAGLPQPERRAVELVYLDGHTIAEVAAYEGRSLAVMKSRLSQGRRRLNRRLAALR